MVDESEREVIDVDEMPLVIDDDEVVAQEHLQIPFLIGDEMDTNE